VRTQSTLAVDVPFDELIVKLVPVFPVTQTVSPALAERPTL
jgi:hypothetical protein